MTSSGVWHLIQWLHYVALALWIGGITFVSAVAAPAAHRSMVSKAVAGELVAKILRRLNGIELACCVILLATSFSSLSFVTTNETGLWYLILSIFSMGILAFYYSFHLTPRMESLKEKIPTLDTLSSNHAARAEFDRLHQLYVKLMSLNLTVGLLVLYGSVVVLK